MTELAGPITNLGSYPNKLLRQIITIKYRPKVGDCINCYDICYSLLLMALWEGSTVTWSSPQGVYKLLLLIFLHAVTLLLQLMEVNKLLWVSVLVNSQHVDTPH